MIGYMFLAIFAVGGGALAIVQGQNPLGCFLIFIGILSVGFVGNCHGSKSGLVMGFQELPDDEEYIYYGKIHVHTGNDMHNTEVAVIRRASEKIHRIKLISVKGFYNNQLLEGDFFTKKGQCIFVRK